MADSDDDVIDLDALGIEFEIEDVQLDQLPMKVEPSDDGFGDTSTTQQPDKTPVRTVVCAHEGCNNAEVSTDGSKTGVEFFSITDAQYFIVTKSKELPAGDENGGLRVCKNHHKIYTKYGGKQKYICSSCDVEVTCYGDYYNHPPPKGKTCSHQSGDTRKCYYCKRWFDTAQNAMTHTKMHTTDPPFVCFCGLTFTTRDDRKRHMDIVHYGITPSGGSDSSIKKRQRLDMSRITFDADIWPMRVLADNISSASVVESKKVKVNGSWRKRRTVWRKCRAPCDTFYQEKEGQTACSECGKNSSGKVITQKRTTKPSTRPKPRQASKRKPGPAKPSPAASSASNKPYKTPAFIPSSSSSSDEDEDSPAAPKRKPGPAKTVPSSNKPLKTPAFIASSSSDDCDEDDGKASLASLPKPASNRKPGPAKSASKNKPSKTQLYIASSSPSDSNEDNSDADTPAARPKPKPASKRKPGTAKSAPASNKPRKTPGPFIASSSDDDDDNDDVDDSQEPPAVKPKPGPASKRKPGPAKSAPTNKSLKTPALIDTSSSDDDNDDDSEGRDSPAAPKPGPTSKRKLGPAKTGPASNKPHKTPALIDTSSSDDNGDYNDEDEQDSPVPPKPGPASKRKPGPKKSASTNKPFKNLKTQAFIATSSCDDDNDGRDSPVEPAAKKARGLADSPQRSPEQPPEKSPEKSPERSLENSPGRSQDKSPEKCQVESPERALERSPQQSSPESPKRSRQQSSPNSPEGSPLQARSESPDKPRAASPVRFSSSDDDFGVDIPTGISPAAKGSSVLDTQANTMSSDSDVDPPQNENKDSPKENNKRRKPSTEESKDERCQPLKIKLQRLGPTVRLQGKKKSEVWKKCPRCDVYQATEHSSPRCCSICKENINKANREKLREVAGGDSDSEEDSTGHYKKMKFRCEECYKATYCYGEYFSHKWQHMKRRGNIKTQKCAVCRAPFTSCTSLIQHMSYHISNPPYGCRACRRGFKESGEYKDHRCKKNHESESEDEGFETTLFKRFKKEEVTGENDVDQLFEKSSVKIKSEPKDDYDYAAQKPREKKRRVIEDSSDDDARNDVTAPQGDIEISDDEQPVKRKGRPPKDDKKQVWKDIEKMKDAKSKDKHKDKHSLSRPIKKEKDVEKERDKDRDRHRDRERDRGRDRDKDRERRRRKEKERSRIKKEPVDDDIQSPPKPSTTQVQDKQEQERPKSREKSRERSQEKIQEETSEKVEEPANEAVNDKDKENEDTSRGKSQDKDNAKKARPLMEEEVPEPSVKDYFQMNIIVEKAPEPPEQPEPRDPAAGRVYPPCKRGPDGLEDISAAYWHAMVAESIPKLFKNLDQWAHVLVEKRVKAMASYSCPQCEKCFNSYGLFLVHLNEHLKLSSKPELVTWVCPFCKSGLDTCGGLTSHLLDAGHVDIMPFACSERDCHYACADMAEMDAHVKSHVRADAVSVLDLIQVTDNVLGDTRHKMFNHMCKMQLSSLNAGSRADLLTCGVCGTTSNCYGDYLHHMDRHDDQSKAKRCVFCRYEVATIAGVVSHYDTTHNKAFPGRPFRCAKCPAEFSQKKDRLEHLVTCGRNPATWDALNRMVLKVTAGDVIAQLPEVMTCSACSFRCNCFGDLFLHLWRHYEEEGRAPGAVACPVCRDDCPGVQNLVLHFITHTDDERPFRCPFYQRCGIGFNSQKMRDNHVKVCERDQISFLYSQIGYQYG